MQAQVCWQCGSMLQTGTMVCPVCGVQQRSQAAPVDMQGAYPGYARQMQPAAPQPVGQQPAQQMVPQPSAPPMSYGVSNTDSAPPSSGRSAQRIASMYALGDAFVGSPASVGKRMLSLLIDLVVIAGVGVGAWLLSSSWILGVVAGLEVAIIFTVTQARTGASLGKLVTRTRVSRADSPQSPGLVRAAVRSAITGAGALLAAVGAFIVELTAAADSSGKRRTIADRAARTVVVSIPTEQARIEAEEVAQEAAHSEYLATLSGSGMELAGGVVSVGVAAESPMMGVRSAELGSGQSGVAAGAGVALSSGVPGAAVPGAGGAGGAGVPGGAAAPGASGAGVVPVLLLAVWAFPVRVLAPVCPVLGRQAPVSLASVDQVLRSKMLPAPVVRRAVLRRLMPTSIRSVPVAHLLRSAMSLTVLPARAVAARLLVSTSHSQRSPRLPSNLQFRRSRAARHP